jgi:hypothetical protein
MYSFYDFKEYMLIVFSFKNIHQIFLNGISFKELRILTRFFLDISQVFIFSEKSFNFFFFLHK